MPYEARQDQAFDLVIRVGFLGDFETRAAYLEHFKQEGTIDLRLTPMRVDPSKSDAKFSPIITHVGIGDALDIEGSVIL